jgi:hypothetical protein
MRVDPDRALLAASLALAGAAVLGSVVAVRDQLPGEPPGVSITLSVPAGPLAGWGPRSPRTCPGVVCAAIGLGCMADPVIEPVTRRPRSWSRAACLVVGVNVVASAALAGAGVWHAATARGQHRER